MQIKDSSTKMRLSVSKIADKDDEGKEQLIIEVLEDCNLFDYMVLDTTYNNDGSVSNLLRHCYLFPDYEVKKGEVVRLYSTKGKNNKGQFTNSKKTYHTFYWGLDKSIWNNEKDKALLMKIANRIVTNV
ncbi:hypothetical protein [Dysgonomonas sp. Marseille-Q5470]|uniref:hypothetical protein n=1 Tax=Dysgonomonas sp. Marseille-Q5470 TaxID=3039494 RepID=UPI0024BBEBB8|nr:hypothetical protein [Dysgonomonas sp. Marseille-Q5470]